MTDTVVPEEVKKRAETNKDLTYQWNKGWRLGFNDDASIDYLTNVGSCLGSSCVIANENEIENSYATTTQAEVYTLRFKASSTPYVNTSFSSQFIGNTVTGTTFEFADKDTPFTYIYLGASVGRNIFTTAFEWNGKIFRILGYSEYHNDTKHNEIVGALKTLYGIS